MSPRPPDHQVRTALLEAAADRLAAEGLDGLSTRKLAAEVGTSTMAVYTHFGGKEELLRAVVLEGFARLADHLDAVGETNDPVRDLWALGLAYRRNALDNPRLYAAMFGGRPLSEVCLDDDDLLLALGTFETLVRACQRCLDARRIKPASGDAGSIAAQCWAAAHGVATLELGGYFLVPGTAAETLSALMGNVLLGLGADRRRLDRSIAAATADAA